MSTNLVRTPRTEVPPPARPGRRGHRGALVVVAALPAMVLVGLDSSAVNVALPAIGRGLGGGRAALQWTVDAYTLMFAALMLSSGALSDRVGAKRVFAAGLALFTLASAVGGAASGLDVLIGARLVQGTAAAVMLPSSLALVRQAFPDVRRRTHAIAWWTVGGAVALAAGPVVGGALTSMLSWRAIFFANLPIGLGALVVVAFVPRSPLRKAAFDVPGQLIAVITLAAVTFGVIDGGTRGFTDPVVMACLAVAVAGAAVFVAVERRTADPVVPLSLFRSPTVTVTTIVGFSVNASFYGLIFMIGLYLQEVHGLSAMTTGLLFLPMTGLLPGANIISARLSTRFGTRVPITLGQLVAATGPLALVGITAHTDVLLVAILLTPLGFGLGAVIPALTTATLDAIPAERAGLAGAVLNSSRQTGGALAVAAFGSLAGPGAALAGGLRVALAISAVMLLAGAATALALPGRR